MLPEPLFLTQNARLEFCVDSVLAYACHVMTLEELEEYLTAAIGPGRLGVIQPGLFQLH